MYLFAMTVALSRCVQSEVHSLWDPPKVKTSLSFASIPVAVLLAITLKAQK